MKRRFTKQQATAVRAYYDHRKRSFDRSKLDCLKDISEAVRGSRKITGFEASAGRFWFRWKDGITTVHDEGNWWRMKKRESVTTPLRQVGEG